MCKLINKVRVGCCNYKCSTFVAIKIEALEKQVAELYLLSMPQQLKRLQEEQIRQGSKTSPEPEPEPVVHNVAGNCHPQCKKSTMRTEDEIRNSIKQLESLNSHSPLSDKQKIFMETLKWVLGEGE